MGHRISSWPPRRSDSRRRSGTFTAGQHARLVQKVVVIAVDPGGVARMTASNSRHGGDAGGDAELAAGLGQVLAVEANSSSGNGRNPPGWCRPLGGGSEHCGDPGGTMNGPADCTAGGRIRRPSLRLSAVVDVEHGALGNLPQHVSQPPARC